MPLPFLDPKNEEQNKFVLAITRAEIVRSAIAHGWVMVDAPKAEVFMHNAFAEYGARWLDKN